jgi:FkbM family methyltransferase
MFELRTHIAGLATQIAESTKTNGSRLSARFGLNGLPIRLVQPVYSTVVGWIAGDRGVRWSINGVPYRIDIHQRHMMAHEYERPVADFLRDLVRPGFVCFDVGANVGVYAVQFCHWSAPTGRVFAFEPNPVAREILKRHLSMNRFEDRVEIVAAAVGSSEDHATFFACGADGMSRLGTPNPVLINYSHALSVPVVTLDSFVRTGRSVPDVVLVDVEGFELAVLEGAREIIKSSGKTTHFVVELHPMLWPSANSSRDQMAAFLKEMRLRPRCLTGQRDPLEDYGQVYLERVD